jgi:hypothetical protein
MRRSLAFFLLLFGQYTALCLAVIQDPSEGGEAAITAKAAFLQAIQTQMEVHNGVEHVGYLPSIEGFAYFGSKDWQRGAVQYDGIVYGNELLLYDLLADKRAVKRPNGFAIELRSGLIAWFTLHGRSFIYVDSKGIVLKPGIYNEIAAGRITLYAKWQKQLEDQVEGMCINQKFTEQVLYYAVKNNQVHTIRTLRSLLELMDNRSGAVQQHMKQQGIKYKKNREAAFAAATAYFNQIQP